MSDLTWWMLGLVVLVGGLLVHWSYSKRVNKELTLLIWLNQLAHEIVQNLPPGLVDEHAARKWLLEQISEFAKRYNLEPLFLSVQPEVLVNWLLDLLAGLWRQQNELRSQIVGANIWQELLAKRQPALWEHMK